MLKILLFTSCMFAPTLLASPHSLEQLYGLKRFDKSARLAPLSSPTTNISQAAFDIKGVKIGDNVLAQAISLDKRGGQLGRIRGGYRSDKIQFGFEQAYAGSALNQTLALYFEKNLGFINRVSSIYTLQDAYLDITPVKEQTLKAVINKYGQPQTMQEVFKLSGQSKGEIKLETFIHQLSQDNSLHPLALEYFQSKNISQSAKWARDNNNYALMHSGFDRCYLWQQGNFTQILSFCFFDKSGANVNSRGVELNLLNFAVDDAISNLLKRQTQTEISL